MELFDRFKKAKAPADAGTETGTLWDISDKNTFLIAMHEHLSRKCSYGQNIAVLTAEERIAYTLLTFETEVNNGGFAQYLFNSSGALSGELAASLSVIGADRIAEMYREALESIPCELPADDEQRRELLTGDLSELFGTCDRAFYKDPDNLDALLYRYILDNKSCFT